MKIVLTQGEVREALFEYLTRRQFIVFWDKKGNGEHDVQNLVCEVGDVYGVLKGD